jgi:hypothetical protein
LEWCDETYLETSGKAYLEQVTDENKDHADIEHEADGSMVGYKDSKVETITG